MTKQERIHTIMNSLTMLEWIENVGTNAYGGGRCYTLYLDLDDDTLFIDVQASSNSWLQREDGSLVKIADYENPDSEEQDPYDDWEYNYRDEIEARILQEMEAAEEEEDTF